jgi:glycosyltransferase involved in cell wall biosynthesis
VNEPLVSIAVVAYNSQVTLGRALASLLNQTYLNWECIVIDDGSDERLDRFIPDDQRFRYFRLESNSGIAVARQRSLDEARGELLCFLDSDDWYYPRKVEAQVAVMQEDPDLAAVGMPVAVAKTCNALAGVLGRQRGIEFRPQRPSDLRFPLPATMVRMCDAKDVKYRPELRRSSDRDFFSRLLSGRRVKVMPEPLYTYTGHDSFRYDRLTVNHRYRRLMYHRNFNKEPLRLLAYLMVSHVKCALYLLASILGIWEWIRVRRYQTPTASESLEYSNSLSLLPR